MSENKVNSPPTRLTEVSSIVMESEAEMFDRYVERLHKLSEAFKIFIERDCDKITRAAKKVLGDDTTTEVCGSFSKGTNIYGSDLDFYIDTTYPVTVESRLILVEELKHTFNESNVGLGRLAIHVNTELCDIDIVCSNTAEYGVRPRANKKIHENVPVQYAARCLKEWSKHNIRGKVKGYMLEEMALAVFLSYPVSGQFGSGGLQLFLSVLQTMVDSEEFGTSIYGLRGGSGCTKELRDVAKLTLHQFLMSRPIRGGFHSVAEIALWICSIRDNDIETTAGNVFSWMALPSVHDIGSTSLCTSTVHQFSSFPDAHPTTTPRISPSSHEIDFLKKSMFGNYLLTGSKKKTPDIVPHEMESQAQGTKEEIATPKNSKKKNNKNTHKRRAPDPPQSITAPSLRNVSTPSSGAHGGQRVGDLKLLLEMARDGDALAIDMVRLREEWTMGESLMEEQNYSQAIARFATAIRMAAVHADPFWGQFTLNIKRYTTAIREVQAKDPYNEDACLIEAMVFVFQHNITQAIAVLEKRIRRGTNDALGLLCVCGQFYGNRHLWKDALAYFCRCYDIDDEEPIFCYWKAIALKNMIANENANVQEVVDLFEEFLKAGNCRGRKYAHAAYECAFLNFFMATSTKDPDEVRKLEERAAEAGVIAVQLEDMTLPFFPPLVCEAKTMVIAWMEIRSPRDKIPAAPVAPKKGVNIDAQKEVANLLFKAHQYLGAIRIYSNLLTADPDNYKVRSNRVAAFCALGYFSKAIDDGHELVRSNPSWAKGQYRLGTAYLGHGQLDAAKTCFEEARRLNPTDTDIERQYRACLQEQQLQVSGRDVAASVSIPIDLMTLPCAEKIQHWSCVKFVDSRGAGDYRSVTDALYATRCEAAVTLVLLPGVHHDQVNLSFVDTVIDDDYTHLDTKHVQILGWFPTSTSTQEEDQDLSSVSSVASEASDLSAPLSVGAIASGSKNQTHLSSAPRRNNNGSSNVRVTSELRGFASADAAKGRHFDPSKQFTLLFLTGRCVRLDIEDVKLTQPVGHPQTCVGACVSCDEGVQVRLRNCTLQTPSSPCCISTGENTLLTLEHCVFPNNISAVVVVTRQGHFQMRHCVIRGALKGAVEVRTRGVATVEDCRFMHCNVQAISIYNDGAQLTVMRSSFRHCGHRQSRSVILVETGRVTIRECQFQKNTGNGIVVQETQVAASTFEPPVVFVQQCRIEHSPVGIGFYYGSGMILDTVVTGCSLGGVSVRHLVRGKKLSFRGNNFRGNGRLGGRGDWVVEGETMFRECVRVMADNTLDSSATMMPFVVSDAQCRKAYAQTRAMSGML